MNNMAYYSRPGQIYKEKDRLIDGKIYRQLNRYVEIEDLEKASNIKWLL